MHQAVCEQRGLVYELTTGQRLFEGDNEFAILKKIVSTDAPPPSQLCSDYPPELERIVLRALARDRDRRYQTAQELQLDLDLYGDWASSDYDTDDWQVGLSPGNFADRPEVVKKLRFLDDCTSSIQGFEAATEAAIQGFAEQGVRLVRSTDPLG